MAADGGSGGSGGRWLRQAAADGTAWARARGSDCHSGCQVLLDKMRSEVFYYFKVFLAGSTEETNKKVITRVPS
jgi:hypothetical protein